MTRPSTPDEALMQLLIDHALLMRMELEHIRTTLERIEANFDRGTSDRQSWIQTEDRSNGEKVAVLTKTYPSDPLTEAAINQSLDMHGYAKRRAKELAMAGWPETLEMLGGTRNG